MLKDEMGTAETLLIAVFLIMSVVLGLVILWVARNLRKDPADPQNRVAEAEGRSSGQPQNGTKASE